MNSLLKWNKSKWVPLIIFVLAILILVILVVWWSDLFQKYSGLITLLTTITYVYLTYEILRNTIQGKDMPFINVEFIIASKIDEGFLAKYSPKRTERLEKEIEELARDDQSPKNFVFVRIENIGDTNAIATNLNLEIGRRSMTEETSGQRKHIELGVIKTQNSRVELIEVFDNPGKDDYVKVEGCNTNFSTVNSKLSSDGSVSNDLSSSVYSTNYDDGVVIVFKNSGN